MKDNTPPIRMCIACRENRPKKDMLRIVRTAEGKISLDSTSRANGRGAYICDSADCISLLKKKRLLNKAFSENVPDSVYEELLNEYNARKN